MSEVLEKLKSTVKEWVSLRKQPDLTCVLCKLLELAGVEPILRCVVPDWGVEVYDLDDYLVVHAWNPEDDHVFVANKENWREAVQLAREYAKTLAHPA